MAKEKEICPICGEPIQVMIKPRIKDNIAICRECMSKTSFNQSAQKFMSVDDLIEHLKYREKNREILNSLQITNEIKTSVMPAFYFRADVKNGYWYLVKKNDTSNVPVYSIAEVLDYELIEDGDMVAKGGLGRALVGGALFGGVGALVGGATGKRSMKSTVNTMKLRILLNNKYTNLVEIDFLQLAKDVKKDSFLYKSTFETASQVISLLESMQATKPSLPGKQNFCSSCGTKMADGARFCSGCGASVVMLQ